MLIIDIINECNEAQASGPGPPEKVILMIRLRNGNLLFFGPDGSCPGSHWTGLLLFSYFNLYEQILPSKIDENLNFLSLFWPISSILQRFSQL
jgi:hypothetical protein